MNRFHITKITFLPELVNFVINPGQQEEIYENFQRKIMCKLLKLYVNY